MLAVQTHVKGPDGESEFRTILAKPSFRPDLSRVALDPVSRAVVGCLLVQNSPGDSQGWIDSIAVRRSERGRQVTAALVASALRGFLAAGLTSAGLGVMLDEAVAQDLWVCEALGFTVAYRWTRFVRPVDGTIDSSVKLAVSKVADLPDDELRDVAVWLAARNRLPASYVGYLGSVGEQVYVELKALSPGAVLAQLHHRGKRVGLMMAEWDPKSSRAWLHGPWAPLDEAADALYAALSPHIPAEKNELEAFCDRANRIVTDFAACNGLLPDGVFNNLAFARGGEVAEPVNPVLPYEERHFAAFERLHYNAHPDTELTAARIVAEGVPLWLVFRDGAMRGYFTYRYAAGESIARIEHMSTDPSLPEDIRTEVWVDLLRAALRTIFENPRIGQVEMVTRSVQSDPGASAVGFELVRSMRIFRTVPRLTTHVSTI
ncbi:Acetyltransferase (GNAT) family protein [Asanoa hainanensis]|uniref:Acetyltransferase (GNAT) family protein n=1 Tax=Asanoa hainanensis TaxID=560556 RepID=A0A239FY26_9ACTN|nr:GNAT family N-acetyltransferase [Asanoa hainanensis]SNS61655.1 Acetyltransferase (GNAT) family protein [Asanoa hainanensis]